MIHVYLLFLSIQTRLVYFFLYSVYALHSSYFMIAMNFLSTGTLLHQNCNLRFFIVFDYVDLQAQQYQLLRFLPHYSLPQIFFHGVGVVHTPLQATGFCPSPVFLPLRTTISYRLTHPENGIPQKL